MPQIPYDEPMPERESDVKWLEDANSLLEGLEHDLRGEEILQLKGEYVWKKTGEPMMNDKGIRFVISSIRHITNKNTFMSNLTPKRISDLCFDTEVSIASALFYKYQDFGISPEYFDVINCKIANVIEIALRRAEGAGERRNIGSMTQNITKQEIKQFDNPPAEAKGLSRFKPF